MAPSTVYTPISTLSFHQSIHCRVRVPAPRSDTSSYYGVRAANATVIRARRQQQDSSVYCGVELAALTRPLAQGMVRKVDRVAGIGGQSDTGTTRTPKTWQYPIDMKRFTGLGTFD